MNILAVPGSDEAVRREFAEHHALGFLARVEQGKGVLLRGGPNDLRYDTVEADWPSIIVNRDEWHGEYRPSADNVRVWEWRDL